MKVLENKINKKFRENDGEKEFQKKSRIQVADSKPFSPANALASPKNCTQPPEH